MNKLRTFWITFKRSLSDPRYYKDVIAAPLSFSIKYLAFLIFLTSIVSGIYLALNIAKVLPRIPEYTQVLKNKAYSLYPPQLVLTMKNYELSTNVKEPYVIPLPIELHKDASYTRKPSPSNFIVIDTKATVEDFTRYDTLVLATKKAVVYNDSKEGIKVYLFSDRPEFKEGGTFNKQMYDMILGKIEPYLSYIQPIATAAAVALVVLVPFLITGFLLIGRLISLIFWSGATWILAKVLSVSLTYSEAYHFSIHAITPLILIEVLMTFVKGSIPGIFKLVIFLVFVGYMLKNAPLKATAKKKGR